MAVKIKKILRLRPADCFRMIVKLNRNQRIRQARNSLCRPANPLNSYRDGRKPINPNSFRAAQWRLHSLKTDISFKHPLITAHFR